LPVFRWREVRGTLLILPYLMLIGLVLTAAIYAGEPRFRIAYDGVLAILAGKAWLAAMEAVARRKRGGAGS